MKTALTLAMTFALALLATPVAAQEGPIPGPGGPDDAACLPGAAQRVIANFLQLTDDQVAQWDVLIDERNAAAAPLRDQIADVDAQIQDLLASDVPDPYAVGDLVILRRDLAEQLAQVHRTYVEGFDALLTEEQQNQYHFIRRAERAQPLFPSFRTLGLLPPHWR
jgi:Spy/CpxP family protein refolding chaperone